MRKDKKKKTASFGSESGGSQTQRRLEQSGRGEVRGARRTRLSLEGWALTEPSAGRPDWQLGESTFMKARMIDKGGCAFNRTWGKGRPFPRRRRGPHFGPGLSILVGDQVQGLEREYAGTMV